MAREYEVYFQGWTNLIAMFPDGDGLRCHCDLTDIRDDEPLDEFIARHGGLPGTAEYLRKCSRDDWARQMRKPLY